MKRLLRWFYVRIGARMLQLIQGVDYRYAKAALTIMEEVEERIR